MRVHRLTVLFFLATILSPLACLAQATSGSTGTSGPPPQGTPPWLLLLTPAILLVSLIVSLVSLRFTLLASRADTFRNLRIGFNKLREDLPDRFWLETAIPSDPAKFNAMVKYWQYAFDEWFITQRLNPRVFGKLWKIYYHEVIKLSCQSPAMVAALFKAAAGAGGEPDQTFINMLLKDPYTPKEVLKQAKSLAASANISVPSGV